MNRFPKYLYILTGLIIAVLFLLILLIVPQWQSKAYRTNFPPEAIEKLTAQERINLEKNAADIENSTRLTIAQIIGGLALLSGLYFTYKNIRVNEEGKITERFSTAVELLGSDKLDIRLGGIYALERIARDSQKDHWTVMEVLTAFVRENAPYIPKQEENPQEPTKSKPREDIQAIMTVIGRRKWTETETQKLDLQKVDLAGCILVGANLIGANLFRANLSRAKLFEANLSRAFLSGTNLSETNLSRADLNGADLIETDLSGANLSGADLSRARLNRADLSKASLNGADLSGAILYESNLSRANLWRAYLSEANLRLAKLSKTDLSGADLSGAESITLEQILSARDFEKAKLSPKLEKELKEWQAKQAENR